MHQFFYAKRRNGGCHALQAGGRLCKSVRQLPQAAPAVPALRGSRPAADAIGWKPGVLLGKSVENPIDTPVCFAIEYMRIYFCTNKDWEVESRMARLDHDLFDRFYKSWRGIDIAYDKIAADCGMTNNGMTVLTLLYKNRAPMSQHELSQELHLPRQTVTNVIDNLEARGYATRSIDPKDRRSRVVTLTEEGRISGRRIGRAMREVEIAAFSALSVEECQAVVGLMETLWHSFAQVLKERDQDAS